MSYLGWKFHDNHFVCVFVRLLTIPEENIPGGYPEYHQNVPDCSRGKIRPIPNTTMIN